MGGGRSGKISEKILASLCSRCCLPPERSPEGNFPPGVKPLSCTTVSDSCLYQFISIHLNRSLYSPPNAVSTPMVVLFATADSSRLASRMRWGEGARERETPKGVREISPCSKPRRPSCRAPKGRAPVGVSPFSCSTHSFSSLEGFPLPLWYGKPQVLLIVERVKDYSKDSDEVFRQWINLSSLLAIA